MATQKHYLTAADVRHQRDVNGRVLSGRASRRPIERRRVIGGGGGSADLIDMILLENIPGNRLESSADRAFIRTVKVLLCTRETDYLSWDPDPANVADAEARIIGSFTLGDAAPCGCDETITSDRIIIFTPIMENNFVDDSDSDVVIVQGTGVNRQSTVAVTFTDGGGSPATVGPISATVNADGTWEIAATNISSLASGAIQVKAVETDVQSNVLPAAYAAITLRGSVNTSVPLTPTEDPVIEAEDDTGSSSTDGVTAELRPTFRGVLRGSNGMGRVYDRGVLIATSNVNDNQQIAVDKYSFIATPTADLANGDHSITYTDSLTPNDPDVESGHSPTFDIVIDPGETGGPTQNEQPAKVHFAWGVKSGERYVIMGVDPCSWEAPTTLEALMP